MKTSFYFVLWIAIYPILDLFHDQFLYNNSFVVALAIVWGLSYLLNRWMPRTLTYERVSSIAPIMENIYTDNLTAFIKRLTSETRVEIVTSVYFIVTTFVIAYAVLKAGVNDWLALIIFVFFAFGAVSRAIKMDKALSQVKANPTQEQCAATATEVYKLDYSAYAQGRNDGTYEQMLPPRPAHFKVFQIFSMIMAAICAVLGLIYIVLAIIAVISVGNIPMNAIAGMYFLYGSLAAYFGIKDFITIVQALRHKAIQ